jgi:hypothetical protein
MLLSHSLRCNARWPHWLDSVGSAGATPMSIAPSTPRTDPGLQGQFASAGGFAYMPARRCMSTLTAAPYAPSIERSSVTTALSERSHCPGAVCLAPASPRCAGCALDPHAATTTLAKFRTARSWRVCGARVACWRRGSGRGVALGQAGLCRGHACLHHVTANRAIRARLGHMVDT